MATSLEATGWRVWGAGNLGGSRIEGEAWLGQKPGYKPLDRLAGSRYPSSCSRGGATLDRATAPPAEGHESVSPLFRQVCILAQGLPAASPSVGNHA